MNEQSNRIRIVFFIGNLEAGGAERVLLNVLRNIDRKKYAPVLCLLSREGDLLPLVPTDTPIVSLHDVQLHEYFGFWFYFHLKRINRLGGKIRSVQPHVLLSFMWYPNALALILKKLVRGKWKLIVSERTSTSIYAGRRADAWRSIIIRFLYPSADGIIAPSCGIADDLIGRAVPRRKISVVHNPVDIEMIREKAKEPVDHPWLNASENVIIAVGRLGSEKGFDCLIRAIALCRQSAIDCRLLIVGGGSERERLELLIRELHLNNMVEIVGFQENPYKYLARSTVFVLSSLYEGFPNVLLEAMALGIPSIATRCPTGPDEIITNGVDGILVPPADEKALADAIKGLLGDEGLRKRLGEAGRKWAEDFRVDKIVKQYEDVIERVCAGFAAE